MKRRKRIVSRHYVQWNKASLSNPLNLFIRSKLKTPEEQSRSDVLRTSGVAGFRLGKRASLITTSTRLHRQINQQRLALFLCPSASGWKLRGRVQPAAIFGFGSLEIYFLRISDIGHPCFSASCCSWIYSYSETRISSLLVLDMSCQMCVQYSV